MSEQQKDIREDVVEIYRKGITEGNKAFARREGDRSPTAWRIIRRELTNKLDQLPGNPDATTIQELNNWLIGEIQMVFHSQPERPAMKQDLLQIAKNCRTQTQGIIDQMLSGEVEPEAPASQIRRAETALTPEVMHDVLANDVTEVFEDLEEVFRKIAEIAEKPEMLSVSEDQVLKIGELFDTTIKHAAELLQQTIAEGKESSTIKPEFEKMFAKFIEDVWRELQKDQTISPKKNLAISNEIRQYSQKKATELTEKNMDSEEISKRANKIAQGQSADALDILEKTFHMETTVKAA